MGVPVYRTASTVPHYTDISVYRYTPTVYANNTFQLDVTFSLKPRIKNQKLMAIQLYIEFVCLVFKFISQLVLTLFQKNII